MPYENMSSNITRPTTENYYAFFFVGVCNRERYVLSLIRWTNILHEMYGYPLANIRILVATYSDPNWSSMVAGTDITYNATRTDLDNALADYATGSGDSHELDKDDNLFIFTFNHGGQDANGCFLCCDNYTTQYYASDFAARIADIHCRKIILLAAQCHSGGFVDPFINGVPSGTKGAVMAGCRSDQNTYEAVFDKLFASAFNGRMVQNNLDDNIDIGISGEYVVPTQYVDRIAGYHTDRIDWGPTGVLSTREAFNWVYDHYVNNIYPNYSQITEIPLYRQTPWIENGKPVHIRLGEPDLIMQDCVEDPGNEPSTCVMPWHSPDLYPDNTDQFSTVGQYEYVPEHNNRFFVRTANRGTAPTDNFWRILEVRGLGFTGGPVGPLRIDRAIEDLVTEKASARLRPNRAHTQYQRILIGGDFGHGCISAATWCGTQPLDHNLWQIIPDNDQVQCNINPATISGSIPVSSGATNSNSGAIFRVVPILARKEGNFEFQLAKSEKDVPVKVEIAESKFIMKKNEKRNIPIKIMVERETPDGMKGKISIGILHNNELIGGMTFHVKVKTAFAQIYAFNKQGLKVPGIKINLRCLDDPRKIFSITDKNGFADFGPLNPGFYFVEMEGNRNSSLRVYIKPGRVNRIKFIVEELGKNIKI